MRVKERRDAVDDAWGVDCLALEFLHDVEEAVVHVGLVGELDLYDERLGTRFEAALNDVQNHSRHLNVAVFA